MTWAISRRMDFGLLLAMSLLHAASLAPITVLADALALGSASPPPSSGRRGFEYGWVRGAGSAAFIAGTLLSGQAVGAFGLELIVGLQASLLGAAAFAAIRVPELIHDRKAAAVRAPAGGCSHAAPASAVSKSCSGGCAYPRQPRHARRICGDPLDRRRHQSSYCELALVEAVAAEVLVFFVIGPALVRRLTPAGAIALAALAGMLRWTVMAQTTDVHRAGAGAAAARHHLCAASSRLHASDRPDGAARTSKGRRRRSMARSESEPPSHCSP